MKRPTRRQTILVGAGLLVVVLVVLALLPGREPVQTAVARYAPLQVVVEEEGETEVEERFVVTSPVPAFVRRVQVEVGDLVQAGQALVQLEPPRAAPLDPRTRAEAAARADAVRAAVAQAEQGALAVEALAARAVQERDRIRRLQAAGAATGQALEAAEAEAARALAEAEGARDAVTAARAELAAAQAALAGPAAPGALPVADVLRAPAAGRVLAVHRESEGHVNPGEPLLEVGDPDRLQVHVAVLSRDAVHIGPGTRVLLDDWGGDHPIEGFVRRVDPQAFTEISALGVEEQRVRVVADIVRPEEKELPGLGAGYRVVARFIVWEGERVLQVPTGALFRVGEGWAVFVVEGGRAVRRPVTVGARAGLNAQVLSGVQEGEEVILHPPRHLGDGMRVRPERS